MGTEASVLGRVFRDEGDKVAAGVRANARTFGSEDYIGFHTLMALHPTVLPLSLGLVPKQRLPLGRGGLFVGGLGGVAADLLRFAQFFLRGGLAFVLVSTAEDAW